VLLDDGDIEEPEIEEDEIVSSIFENKQAKWFK